MRFALARQHGAPCTKYLDYARICTIYISRSRAGAMAHQVKCMGIADRVRVHEVKILSNDWYVLKKTTFSYRRGDGTWQRQSRETYDRGNGATILLSDPLQRPVLLTRQFRYPAFVNGCDDLLIETPAGLLDDATPEDRIRTETEEETGFRVRDVRQVFEAYMSPGSVTEKLHFFVGRYEPTDRVAVGGG